jgi:homoserine kinase
LADHFGGLGWDTDRILEEAYRLEGHPDNVAACWLGGFVTAICEGLKIRTAQLDPPAEWRGIVVLPAEPLATSKARAVLPASYSIEDVVANLQSVAVLSLAFSQARGDLLHLAMNDRIHQPYRTPICPLLPLILPEVGKHGILGAALSGAGPAVLVIVDHEDNLNRANAAIVQATENRVEAEMLLCHFSQQGAGQLIETK